MRTTKRKSRTPYVTRALVMAAGLGTRLYPISKAVPKAFVPVCGIPAIQFSIDHLRDSGIREIVINVHHHGARVLKLIKKLDTRGLKVHVSDERKELLGSAGGIRKGYEFFRGHPFLVVNADVLSTVDLRKLINEHKRNAARSHAWMTMSVHPRGFQGQRYAEAEFDRRTRRLKRMVTRREQRPFYLGTGVYEPASVARVKLGTVADYKDLILKPALRAQRAFVLPDGGFWMDLGTPELWARAHRELLERLEKRTLPLSWIRRLKKSNRKIMRGRWVLRGAQCDPKAFAKSELRYFGGKRWDKLAVSESRVCHVYYDPVIRF